MCLSSNTTLAGAGDHYARISSNESNPSYVRASASIYGARLDFEAATLEITNGRYFVVLDLKESEAAKGPDMDAPGAVQFSAPLLYVPKQIDGFHVGGRVKVLLLPMATFDAQNPRVATQAVMHTARDLHGPGPYPETTRWGAWINGYRAAAAEHSAVKTARRLTVTATHPSTKGTQ